MNYIIAQKMVFGGSCIAKIDGKTVFIGENPAVPTLAGGVLPGEKVEIQTVFSKKDYDTAVVTNIIEASAHRQKPFCAFYGMCGGCSLQHADYPFQLELKRQITEELLKRTLQNVSKEQGFALPSVQTVSGPEKEYRSRFQFHGGGLKRRDSASVVFIDDCPCAVPPLRDFLHCNNILRYCTKPAERITVYADERLLSDNTGIAGTRIVTECDINPVRTVLLSGKKISFDVRAFFQSNLFVLEKALPLISTGLQGQRLLDLYGGTGILSLFAADNFNSVTIVETNKTSLACARRNYRQNGVRTPLVLHALSGSAWVRCPNAKDRPAFDAAIIDPPRTGMEKDVLDYVCRTKPSCIRSLSCDPATHVRDLKKLVHSGYEITDFYLLDFYPHTSHIETLACLSFR